MKTLTKRQRELLDYLESYFAAKRISPSYREIMQHFNFSSLGSVYKHIQSLKKKGFVAAEKNSPRSLTLEPNNAARLPPAHVEIPFIGYIHAGFPIETFSHVELISLPSAFVPKPEWSYLLKVRGNTMNEEQIAEGDLLIIEARSSAEPGEMTIVLVNSHETFIKKYYPDPPYVRLEALNPNVRPMILRKENLEIQGVLVGLFRNYFNS